MISQGGSCINKSKKLVTCRVLKSSLIANVIELPLKSQISCAFTVYGLHDFDMVEGQIGVQDQVNQPPKIPKHVIEDVSDVKGAKLRRGNQYQRFLVKWLGKPTTKNRWVAWAAEEFKGLIQTFMPKLTKSCIGASFLFQDNDVEALFF